MLANHLAFTFARLLLAGLLVVMMLPAGADYGPGDWQLPESAYVPAKMPMVVVHPRDDEAAEWAYAKNAHPDVRWEIPIVIQGGAWPFRYRIADNGGAEGLEIGGELERSIDDGFIAHRLTPDYGVLWWEDPVAGEYDIVVAVDDQDGNTIDLPISLSVGTEGWVFVDAESGDDAATGTLNAPFRTVERIHAGGEAFLDHRVYISGVVAMDGNRDNGNLRIARGSFDDTPTPVVWVGLPGSEAVLEAYEGKIVLDAPDFYMANLEHRHREDFFQDDGSYIHMVTAFSNTDRLTLHDVHFSRFQGVPVNTGLGNSGIIMLTNGGDQGRHHVAVVNNTQSGANGVFTSAYQLRESVFEKNTVRDADLTLADTAVWAVFWIKSGINEYLSLRANRIYDNNDWSDAGGNLSAAMGLKRARNIEFAYNTILSPHDGGRAGTMKLWTNGTAEPFVWTPDTPVWLYRNSLKQRLSFEGNNLADMPDDNVITENNVLDTGAWPTSSILLNIDNLEQGSFFDADMRLSGAVRDQYLGMFGAEIAEIDTRLLFTDGFESSGEI